MTFSFLRSFLGVYLNFNWFPLTALKFCKPQLVNAFILEGSSIVAEETVMVRWSGSPRVKMSDLALCVFDLCNSPLSVRMAKQRWHLCVTEGITFLAAGLGSGLEYVLAVHCVSGPFFQELNFLANMTTSALNDISFKSKEGRLSFFLWHEELSLKSLRECLVPQTLTILNFAGVSRY